MIKEHFPMKYPKVGCFKKRNFKTNLAVISLLKVGRPAVSPARSRKYTITILTQLIQYQFIFILNLNRHINKYVVHIALCQTDVWAKFIN